jgi:hypothetical protein
LRVSDRISTGKRASVIRADPANSPVGDGRGRRNDLHACRGFPNGKRRKTIRRVPDSYLLCRTIQLIQKHLRSPLASLRLPISRGLGFFKRYRVDSNGLDGQRSSRFRRRRRAASHEMSRSAPVSIC